MRIISSNKVHSILIDIFGAQVTAWQSKDEHIFYPQQVTAVPTDDGKIDYRMRGGMFMPFPHFGGEITSGHFTMPQHGIMRDLEFKIADLQKDRVILIKDLSSVKGYNYQALLEITFTATDNGFSIKVELRNKDSRSVPFNIGFHPYFLLNKNWKNVAFLDSHEKPIILDKTVQENCHDGIKRTIIMDSGNHAENSITMRHVRKEKITMSIFGFDHPLFARPKKRKEQYYVWSDNPDKYVCVEPFLDASKNFANEKGIWVPGNTNVDVSCNLQIY